jgi:hypothetical protein
MAKDASSNVVSKRFDGRIASLFRGGVGSGVGASVQVRATRKRFGEVFGHASQQSRFSAWRGVDFGLNEFVRWLGFSLKRFEM